MEKLLKSIGRNKIKVKAFDIKSNKMGNPMEFINKERLYLRMIDKKDSKGKEIYEGDILSYFNPKYPKKWQPLHLACQNPNTKKFVFLICKNPDGGYHGGLHIGKNNMFTIIGNIFENKDILDIFLNQQKKSLKKYKFLNIKK